MSIQIKEVKNKKELKTFIRFPFNLYKGNTCYVPPLIKFEMNTLLKEKNPAFDHADAKYWIAEKDGNIVGRIAAIVLNEELKEKHLARFGWVDFIDDLQVSKILFETAKSWVEEKGARSIHGPMGFTDLDFEGALVGGYDELPTQATLYNYPYYIDHFKKWKLQANVSWVEIRSKLFNEIPERISKAATIASRRLDIRIKEFKKTKDILHYAPSLFDVLNKTYSELYGYHALSKKQIEYYIKQYFGFVKKEYVCIAVNQQDEVVGFAISFPSLSKAFQKAKGSLFPLGFIHLLKSFYFNKHVDLLLIGVLPQYQLWASAIILHHLASQYIKNGVKYLYSGPMLESNHAVLNTWKHYDKVPSEIRRTCFIKHF